MDEAPFKSCEASLEAIARQVAADMLERMWRWFPSAPDTDVSLEEAVKGFLAKVTSGVPKLVFVVFSGLGMTLSVCLER
jgi:hypothetical protein